MKMRSWKRNKKSDFFVFCKKSCIIEVLYFILYQNLTMNELNSLNTVASTTTKMNTLLDKIASTCDALIGALDCTREATSQYGGGIVQDFDTEYVDVVIKTLVQLRLYTARLQKEIKNWLIRSQYDLELFLSGMQELSDKLNTLMRENGIIRNNFEYGLREIDQNLHMMIEEIAIK